MYIWDFPGVPLHWAQVLKILCAVHPGQKKIMRVNSGLWSSKGS